MNDFWHMNVDEIVARIKELDAERLFVKMDIEKRKRDLMMNAESISEAIAKLERTKIDELEDCMDDIEFDLTSYVQRMLELATAGEGVENEFMSILCGKPVSNEEETKKTRLMEARVKAERDLKLLKQHAERKQKELSALQDLIDATEDELDDIIAELAEFEQQK